VSQVIRSIRGEGGRLRFIREGEEATPLPRGREFPFTAGGKSCREGDGLFSAPKKKGVLYLTGGGKKKKITEKSRTGGRSSPRRRISYSPSSQIKQQQGKGERGTLPKEERGERQVTCLLYKEKGALIIPTKKIQRGRKGYPGGGLFRKKEVPFLA